MKMKNNQTHKIYMNVSNMRFSKNPTGIPQYTLNLLSAFCKMEIKSSILLLVDQKDKNYFEEHFPNIETKVVRELIPLNEDFIQRLKGGWRLELLNLWFKDRVTVPWILRNKRDGILFHPFNAFSIHLSKRLKTVVTLHDLFFKNFPKVHSKKMRLLLDHCYRGMIREATKIIVPSEFVKKDILKHFPEANMEKVKVIPNPMVIRENEEKKVELPGPYILSVNALQEHKNLKTLIAAFSIIEKSVPHYLVLVGSGSIADEKKLDEGINCYSREKIIRTGYVTEKEKNYLYNNAVLFVSPSIHEGFGMTPIEAALFQTPVLVSKETSLYEVTQGLTYYYEPAEDHRALADKILSALNAPKSKEELKDISEKYRESYNPNNIAKEYEKVFNSLLEEKRLKKEIKR